MRRNGLKETLRRGVYMMAAVLAACTMTACGSDDGGGTPPPEFTTPAYEASAAKFDITDTDAPYSSVELTAGGNYIIRLREITGSPEEDPNVQPAPGRVSFAAGPGQVAEGTRATVWSNILYGKYTKTGDNEYTLEGYGKLTVTQKDGSAVSLHMVRTDGQEYTISGNKAGNTATGANTDMLCRTWNIVEMRSYARLNGNTLYDITAGSLSELVGKIVEWGKSMDDSFSEEDVSGLLGDIPEPRQFVFSKSGTYMVLYEGGQLAVSTWRWKDQNAGVMQYSWNPDTFNDAYIAGEVTTAFSGKRLEITEVKTDSEDGYSMQVGVVYILEEAK